MRNMNVKPEIISLFDKKKQFLLRRDIIISGALNEFRKYGYNNVSMTNIATGVGLTKAGLYYYVKDKREIFYECHIMAYDGMDEILGQHGATEISGLEKLEATYRGFADMLMQKGQALLTDFDELKGEARENVLRRRFKIEQQIQQLIEAGIKDGSIRDLNPKLAVFFIMGALNWLNAWYNSNGDLSAEIISEHFVAQMSMGLRAQT